MPCQRLHLILLYSLLLVPFLTRSQQRRRDSILIHFAVNKYNLHVGDTALLNQALRHPTIDSLHVIGYTDKTGSLAYNTSLSQRRATAVARYLVIVRSSQIQSSRITDNWLITGGGIAPTPDQSDSANRRAEIVVYYNDPDHDNPVPHQDTIARNPGGANAAIPAPRKSDSIVVVKRTGADTTSAADSSRPAAILALRHINFIVDTPIPTDSTRSILPEFVAELKQFKDHRLEIDGFVNSVVPLRGIKDPLYILSVRRAKFIYDYLVNAGFDPGKLSYKGMGNATPINPTPVTREEMNANMRVEIRVY
jgi:outer membrane protein OmpA-like peptidoglycan-associated protein